MNREIDLEKQALEDNDITGLVDPEFLLTCFKCGKGIALIRAASGDVDVDCVECVIDSREFIRLREGDL